MKRILAYALSAAVLAPLAGCNKETGVSNRHLHGVVTLPPLPMWESELTPAPLEANEDEGRNDSPFPTEDNAFLAADGPYTVSYGYHIIRGASSRPCGPIDAENNTTSCANTADRDWFRVRTAYRGPIAITARMAEGFEGDVDLLIRDKANNIDLYTDDNVALAELDENGDPVVDEEGNPVQVIAPPRFVATSEGTAEFLVQVTVNARNDTADGVYPEYELVLVGNDPREHDETQGIEGDSANFLATPVEPVIQDPLDMKVGAFLNNDVDALGNPVAGTSCQTWTLDEDSETFWCAWDMAMVHSVSVESNVLIEGFGDGKDNDCDGTADTGLETRDEDGDGVAIAEGDCDDTRADVNPNRGDFFGDGIDNDCDGWADNGPDDQDNDGDGYCENGQDFDGDGFCRGVAETAGLAGGDCNDANPAIYPGLDYEIENNHIDDDCDNGDAPLNQAVDTDNPNADPQLGQTWPDRVEEACGTNPLDRFDEPVDADEDGICDSECLGEADCPQDWDADGLHNWVELLCASDPNVANAELPDLDGDGVCDGQDDDADGDGFQNQSGQTGDDCNDMDPTIRPHVVDDETGETTFWNYDIPDGIDNDCDGQVDENRDWTLEGDTFVNNPEILAVDNDGDGYTLGLRDCNDNDADMRPGRYETRSANVVRDDFTMVWLFAGDVGSLNSTVETANARRTPDLVSYDLEKERITWDLVTDFENGQGPRLTPGGAPILEASYAKQAEIGNIWAELVDPETGEEVPNDAVISGFGPGESAPWAQFQELGEAAAPGKTNELTGTIADIVPDSWDGDNDAYHVTFLDGGTIDIELDWDTGGGDYDSTWVCYFFNAFNPPNYYVFPMDGSLTSLAKPEVAATALPLPIGADCYFWVVGYAGSPGPYTVRVTPREE
jgi:hypothetical protein